MEGPAVLQPDDIRLLLEQDRALLMNGCPGLFEDDEDEEDIGPVFQQEDIAPVFQQ